MLNNTTVNRHVNDVTFKNSATIRVYQYNMLSDDLYIPRSLTFHNFCLR